MIHTVINGSRAPPPMEQQVLRAMINRSFLVAYRYRVPKPTSTFGISSCLRKISRSCSGRWRKGSSSTSSPTLITFESSLLSATASSGGVMDSCVLSVSPGPLSSSEGESLELCDDLFSGLETAMMG